MKKVSKYIAGKGILLAIAMFLFGCIAGCTKGGDNNPKPKPKPQISVSGSYTLKNVELYDLNENNTVVIDSTSQKLTDCQKAVVFTFSTDGTFSSSKTACDAPAQGTWSFDSSTNTITVDAPGQPPLHWHGVVTASSDGKIFTIDQKISQGYSITFQKQSS